MMVSQDQIGALGGRRSNRAPIEAIDISSPLERVISSAISLTASVLTARDLPSGHSCRKVGSATQLTSIFTQFVNMIEIPLQRSARMETKASAKRARSNGFTGTANRPKLHDEFLSAAEASELLGVSIQTLYVYVSRKGIRSQP